jgi:hypothetical protein
MFGGAEVHHHQRRQTIRRFTAKPRLKDHQTSAPAFWDLIIVMLYEKLINHSPLSLLLYSFTALSDLDGDKYDATRGSTRLELERTKSLGRGILCTEKIEINEEKNTRARRARGQWAERGNERRHRLELE